MNANQNSLPFGPLKRFGVFGGSFDPVHIGHLSIAQQIFNALQLERVVLLPAATSPHKQRDCAMASAADRLAMCRLAIINMRGLAVSDFEIKRGGVSYTIATARALRQAYSSDAEIYFLIGSDNLTVLPQWREIHALLDLVSFAIAERRETPIEDALWRQIGKALGSAAESKLRHSVVPVERVDISSTFVRQLLAKNEKVGKCLRYDVESYIRRKRLYRNSSFDV